MRQLMKHQSLNKLTLKLYFPAIIWALVILYLSAFSGPQIEINLWFAPDKVNHFAAYFMLSVLIARKNIKNREVWCKFSEFQLMHISADVPVTVIM